MFQAVIEIETEGLSDWEAMRRELYKRADFQVWFAQLSSAVEDGLARVLPAGDIDVGAKHSAPTR